MGGRCRSFGNIRRDLKSSIRPLWCWRASVLCGRRERDGEKSRKCPRPHVVAPRRSEAPRCRRRAESQRRLLRLSFCHRKCPGRRRASSERSISRVAFRTRLHSLRCNPPTTHNQSQCASTASPSRHLHPPRGPSRSRPTPPPTCCLAKSSTPAPRSSPLTLSPPPASARARRPSAAAP